MKKTKINEKIENKFAIKSIEAGLLVTEDLVNEGVRALGLIRYPAVFNTKKDAKRYLKEHNVTTKDMKDFKIENADISFFEHGGVLITYDESEGYPVKKIKVKDLLDILLSKFANCLDKYLSVEIVPIGNATTYRLNMIVYDVTVDEKLKRVTLSNYLYADNFYCDHTINALINNIKDYLDYDIIISIKDDSYDTVFRYNAVLGDCRYDNESDSVKLFSITNSPSIKIEIK